MLAKSQKLTLKLYLVLFLIGIPFFSFSQSSEEQIDELINLGDFEEAIQLSKALLKEQPDNPALNFKLGYCYMNTPLKKTEAIPYLSKASEIYKQTNDNSAIAIETDFHLGKAYHKNYEFAKAIKVLQQLREKVSNNEISEAINEEIIECKTGLDLKSAPINMQVTNVGQTINTSFAEHSPVVSADESVLIFTSRRKQNENGETKPDGQYSEDIYISSFDGQIWSEPKSISPNINTN